LRHPKIAPRDRDVTLAPAEAWAWLSESAQDDGAYGTRAFLHELVDQCDLTLLASCVSRLIEVRSEKFRERGVVDFEHEACQRGLR
jgi:hypothetical protein